MPYTPYYTTWQDSPSTTTPIIAAALNTIETGLKAVSSPVTTVAAPTGVASTDTANINTAITAWIAAGPGVLQFQEGTYVTNGGHLVGGGSPGAGVIQGAGWNTQVKLANSANAYIFDFGSSGSPQYTPGIAVRDLYLNCNGANQTADSGGIYGRGSVFGVFEHIWFDQPYGAGLRFYQDGLGNYGHHNRVIGCLFTNGYVSASYGQGLRFDHADENSVIGCTFQDNGTTTYPSAQCYDTSGGRNHFDSCAFVTTRTTAVTMVRTDSSPSGCMFTGCSFDSGTTGNLLEIGGPDCMVECCQFLSFGSGANTALHLGGANSVASGNTFTPGGSSGTAIYNDAAGCKITGNTFAGSYANSAPVVWSGVTVPPLNVLDYGADPTGTSDSYAAVQAALTAARTGGGAVVYVPAGTYLSSQTLQIGSGTTLRGDGMGLTTIKAQNSFAATQVGSAAGMYLLCSYSNGSSAISNVTVRDLTLDGNIANVTSPLPGYATQALCSPLAPVNITKLAITGVEIIGSVGYAAWIQSCSKVQIRGCVINVGNTSAHSWANQDGFHVTDCTGVEITGNTLATGTNGGDDAIAIQGVSTGTTSVTITGNTITAAGAHGIGLFLGGSTVSGVTIAGNTIASTVNEGLIFGFNTYVASGTYLITDVTITGNTFKNIATGNAASGITLQDAYGGTGAHAGTAGYAGVTIAGNVLDGFTNTAGFGIYAQGGSDLAISDNTIRAWKAVRGIDIGDNSASTSRPVTGFTVSGNTIDMTTTTATAPAGIVVVDSPDGMVEGNTILGAAGPVASSIGISLLSIGTAITGSVVDSNRVKTWATAISETNNGAAPDYNTYVGNNCHGNTAFITIVGTHDLPTSGNTATLNVVA